MVLRKMPALRMKIVLSILPSAPNMSTGIDSMMICSDEYLDRAMLVNAAAAGAATINLHDEADVLALRQ